MKIFDAIGFDLGHFESQIKDKLTRIDIVYTIDNINKESKPHPQLRIKDLRVRDVV